MKHKLPSIKELSKLLKELKKCIDNESLAFEDDIRPGMQVTIGVDTVTGDWNYQTGDNSFAGGAYFYPIWGVGYLYQDSNCREVAKDIIADIESCIQ